MEVLFTTRNNAKEGNLPRRALDAKSTTSQIPTWAVATFEVAAWKVALSGIYPIASCAVMLSQMLALPLASLLA